MGVGLIVWWIVEEILTNSSTWWQFQTESLAVVLTEWAVVILVLIGINWWMKPLVIYEPRNHHAKKILGFFFKLTPKSFQSSNSSDLEQSQSPTIPVKIHTHTHTHTHTHHYPSSSKLAQIEEAKYQPYKMYEKDNKQGSIGMSPQQSRRNSRSSITPVQTERQNIDDDEL